MLRCFILIYSCLTLFNCSQKSSSNADVLIIQASTGGTAAAIQAARAGVNVILVEPFSWLGGMLTAAGVSAVDGNHQLPSGIWGEFRDSLENRYGGLSALSTGWVSNTLFEPHIGDQIFKNMCRTLPNLKIYYNTTWNKIEKSNNKWLVHLNQNGQELKIEVDILIDGTDMGDVAASVGVSYDLGMDNKLTTQEEIALDSAVNIIQDFTYSAILKDYKNNAPEISKPKNYNRSHYLCSCDTFACTIKAHPCSTMLSYGRLPNNKYMINWPIYGNDYYFNLVESTKNERDSILQKAKDHTLGFLYFIQQELGFRNLGIADDEFPTDDKLPFLPYYREGRRIHGLVKLGMQHAEKPFDQAKALYRTGIAVGDYPIDHHHGKNAKVPKLDYVPIPSFSIPVGVLIPKNVDNLIIAEKAISVTNVMNGATRLQPVILQIGQTAGMMAAICIHQKSNLKDISIRELQQNLLDQKVYLMPFIDVDRNDSSFAAIQRIGATGILRGRGIAYKWANQTWFYPDSSISRSEFMNGMDSWQQGVIPWHKSDSQKITTADLDILSKHFAKSSTSEFKYESDSNDHKPINRRKLALFLDQTLNPFHSKDLNWDGSIK